MNTENILNGSVTKDKPQDVLAGAIDIAIRDAEVHGTKLAIKSNGEIEEVSPDEMRVRLKRRLE